MTTTTNREVTTKLDARAEKTITAVTFNWEGMTPEEIRALAEQALTVKIQGKWRSDGIIPTSAEINVVEHKIGVRAPKKPVNVLDAVKAMTAEEKAALLAMLQA